RAARTRAGRPAPLPMHRPVRAVWVARYHYRTPADVARIMDNCARLGCNTVLWQVRGECTVTYPSQIEPWGQEFGFRNPGFDPLALAIAEAHARGLRIEAWFNTLPGWRGATPPPLAEHTFHQHPDWFLQDAAGRRQPLTQDYVSLNPCLPEVRRHIMSVADEIAASYDIDGLHLDYVRYIWDGIRNAVSTYPYDARTVALFERETGRTPDEDPTGWLHWRANQLSRLVADIQAVLAHRRPGATLTAAVRGHPSDGYWQFLQNGVGWLRSGLVDAVMPMVYTSDPHRFRADVAAWHDLAGGQPVIPGLGIYKHNTAEPMSDQLACCATWGGDFALFSYESLCATSPGDRNASAQALRDMRCALLAQFGN
ncbi:MAG: family 10 glycosylhydrolase, partial [Planctomycetota bacterium]